MNLSTERIEEARVLSQKNFLFFKSQIDKLIAQYYRKFVVIKDEAVIGAYDSFDEAYEATIKKEAPGTFIIQECVSSDEANTAHFFSNNIMFAQV